MYYAQGVVKWAQGSKEYPSGISPLSMYESESTKGVDDFDFTVAKVPNPKRGVQKDIGG